MAPYTEIRLKGRLQGSSNSPDGIPMLCNYAMFSRFAGLYVNRTFVLSEAVVSGVRGCRTRQKAMGVSVLDIGASDGSLSMEVAKRLDDLIGMRRLVALEPESYALPSLRKRASQAPFEFVVLDRDLDSLLSDSNFAQEKYDVITAVHSAYHFTRLTTDLLGLSERLNPDGVLIAVADSNANPFYRFIDHIGELLEPCSVALFGERVFGETIAYTMEGKRTVSRLNQALSFRSVSDLLLATAFVGRFDLSDLSSRIYEIVEAFELAFGPLPTTIQWPEICISVDAAGSDRGAKRII